MKRSTILCLSLASALALTPVSTFAQSVHRIDGIRPGSDGTMSLSLTGSVASSFIPYFDIYLLEASTDLVDWTPLPPLLRTNAIPEPLQFHDETAPNYPAQFYRMGTNHLVTSFPLPNGPYRVGMISRLMTDPSRTNRYDIPTNSSFMISIWYPAQATAGLRPGRWLDAPVAMHVMWRGYSDRVLYLMTHSLPGAAVATNEAAY